MSILNPQSKLPDNSGFYKERRRPRVSSSRRSENPHTVASMPVDSIPLKEMPVAVVDVETTGLNPRADRIVEVGCVAWNPVSGERSSLQTLINPGSAVHASEIHGILAEDVRDAPTFTEVSGDLIRLMSGHLIIAYNAYFDIRFLAQEFLRFGLHFAPPFLCLMHLRPALGLGGRCTLKAACADHGIRVEVPHCAIADASCTLELWQQYLPIMNDRGCCTLRKLRTIRPYDFFSTLSRNFVSASEAAHIPECARLVSGNLVRRTERLEAIRGRERHSFMDSALAAARVELDRAENERKHGLHDWRNICMRLLSAEIGLIQAENLATRDDWNRLRSLVVRGESLATPTC